MKVNRNFVYVISVWGFMTVVLVTASCAKADRDGEQICFRVSADATKSIISGTDMPSTYTMYVSSKFTNLTDPGNSGNYFVARPFRENSGRWVSSPASIWPLGGKLNFLSVACEDGIDVTEDVSWSGGDCSRGLVVKLKDGSCLDSEILYAAAENRTSEDGGVSLQFRHTQSWLQFSVSTNAETVRIDSIKVMDVYTGGTLRIDNRNYTSAEWSFRGHRKSDRIVPGSKGLIPQSGTPAVCNMLVPQQDACDIDIYYSLKSNPSDDWSTAVGGVYHYEADATLWRYGEKNVFCIRFDFAEITMTSSVKEWGEETVDISIEHE